MIYNYQKSGNQSSRSPQQAAAKHGYNGCNVIFKVTSTKGAWFCDQQPDIEVFRQHYGNNRYKDITFCNHIHKSRSEISRGVSCCVKTTVVIWITVGDRSLKFTLKKYQPEIISNVMADYLNDFDDPD